MRSQRNALAIPFLLALAGPAAQAEELKLLFPLGRKAYRTDESIDVAAVRSGDAALPAGELGLVLSGEDGSRIALSFPVAPAPLEGGSARRTEHLRIDARLLRPGGYAVEAAAGGVRASERIEVFSSLRRSTFRLIDWGSRAQGADLAKLGEEGLGFNLIFGEYRLDRSTANVEATLRGGADYMQCCTMGGGHTRAKLLMAYLASKIIHVPFSSIVEEDIVDGTLAANHKAVVLAGIDDLEAPALAALEAYARSGGLVLVTADSLVEVKGASRLDAPADPRQHKLVEELWKTDQKESMRERSAARFLKAAAPLARALKEKLSAAGIRPVLECDAPAVVASRHMRGDVEYLFAVNATPDESSESFLAIRASTAALGFPADGRPIYHHWVRENVKGHEHHGPGSQQDFQVRAEEGVDEVDGLPLSWLTVSGPNLRRVHGDWPLDPPSHSGKHRHRWGTEVSGIQRVDPRRTRGRERRSSALPISPIPGKRLLRPSAIDAAEIDRPAGAVAVDHPNIERLWFSEEALGIVESHIPGNCARRGAHPCRQER